MSLIPRSFIRAKRFGVRRLGAAFRSQLSTRTYRLFVQKIMKPEATILNQENRNEGIKILNILPTRESESARPGIGKCLALSLQSRGQETGFQ
jgi:hypothetical protein